MDEISIDTVVLASEISCLQELRATGVSTAFAVSSRGRTADRTKVLMDRFFVLDASLNIVIDNVLAFLEQAKEGYITADHTIAGALSQSTESVR